MCTDKYAVRDYIREKGLEDILIPVVGGPWENVEDVDFDSLPDSFALKATHGCKMNYLVADKKQLDRKKCKAEMSRWLATTYGAYSMEPHYLTIPHRIYAEEFLADAAQLTDYKFHCANGEPLFVLTVYDRKTDGDNGMSLSFDIDRSLAGCYNNYRVLWIGLYHLPSNGFAEAPTTASLLKC